MIRRQRRAHVRIWTALAIVLPFCFALILALAPSPALERAPVRLDPVPAAGGGG